MKYLSVKEVAERWEMSQVSVRRYCLQGRIPDAVCKNKKWMIPEDAERPQKILPDPDEAIKMPRLAAKLVHQKNGRNYKGLYDYTQINLTYSSSRMASCRLTKEQVETIFRKGKVCVAFEPMKVSDLIEVMNHCVCVNYILDHVMEPLTQKLILKLHYKLMFGTVDDRLGKVSPGVFRTASATGPKDLELINAKHINTALNELITKYEALPEVERNDILDFHVRFERIFPFRDGNGRIGRLLMFKECLRHNIMPFILDDKRRTRYHNGIRVWDEDRGELIEVVLEAQSRYEAQIEIQKMFARSKEELPIFYEEDDEDEEEIFE